jgi:4'-phosphopantetheinyl transferase
VSVSEFAYPGNELNRPRGLASPMDGVALWWCVLDAELDPIPSLAAWLSPPERARAERYRYDSLAQRYTRGRAALRWILAQRLGVPPQSVPIEPDERGRPRLSGRTGLDFNVSNTRNIALVGLVDLPGTRIGIDVEHEDRALNHLGLARKFLTSREQAAIAPLDVEAHRRAFLRLWTCKEAMSKATGQALSAPLRVLDVELTPSLRLAEGPPPYCANDWRLAAVDAPGGFLATVALWRTPESVTSTRAAPRRMPDRLRKRGRQGK